MRSRTLSHLPGRCPRCWIREAYCICALVPSVDTRTDVVVVRHEREAWKSTGTVRAALAALPRARLIEYLDDGQAADEALKPLVAGALLLFPDPGPTPAPEAPTQPQRLIVLDGTWRQTRRMLKRLPSLSEVPRLMLGTPVGARLRLRESADPLARSTLEAIADGLELLEGVAASQPLHALHERLVENVFRARGVWTQKSRVVAS